MTSSDSLTALAIAAPRGVGGLDLVREEHVEFGQPLVADVVDGDVGAHAGRHLRRVHAGNAAAEDRDLGRSDARNAAEQDSAAARLLFEIVSADLDGHASSDFAHRLQKRERAIPRRHRLISDAGCARLHQAFRLGLVGGEVQVGEEDMPRLQQRDLRSLRLLDLHDHIRGLEHRRGVGENFRAGLLVGAVGAIDPIARACLDDNLVAGRNELGNRSRGQTNPIFVNLDLLRHTNPHYSFAPLMMIARAYRRANRPCPPSLRWSLRRVPAGASAARRRSGGGAGAPGMRVRSRSRQF